MLTPEGLAPMLETQIFGRIAVLRAYRPAGERYDLLFLSTERYQFCVLGYDHEKQVRCGEARCGVARCCRFGEVQW